MTSDGILECEESIEQADEGVWNQSSVQCEKMNAVRVCALVLVIESERPFSGRGSMALPKNMKLS